VTPSSPTIQTGATQQFTATGTYSDSSTQNITNQVTWTSSNTSVATINAAGLATGVAAGSTTISAAQGTVTGSQPLNIQTAALSITTTTLTGGTVSVAYSATLAATGGAPPYTWSLTTGSLPAGLTLNANGSITGTPTTAGTSNFTVQVSDSAPTAATASKSLAITVAQGVINTGFKAPAANAAVTTSAGDNNGFQNSPANAYAVDGAVAEDPNSGNNTSTSCTNSGKDKHLYYNFNLNVPTGATIRGIEVQLNARVSSTANSPRMCVQLSWNGGTNWTTAQATTNLTTTIASYVLGGAANTWGQSWTAARLANTAFRVRIINVSSSTGRTFSLDGVAVRVSYQ
jgi:hypothetical protein